VHNVAGEFNYTDGPPSINKISIALIFLENIMLPSTIIHNSPLLYQALKVNGMHQDKYWHEQ
jgi:hypothetical protein